MDDRPSWRVSLVLPAFNEAACLRQTVAEADEALGRFCLDHEILVVDDGSRDETSTVLRELVEARPHVRVLSHSVNCGYGAALRTGFEAARFDRVAFTDADGQFNLDHLQTLLRENEAHPIVVGWRIDRQDPWLRRFLSKGYNLMARGLLGTRVRDIDCAFKVFRRDTLHRLLPETPGFFVNTEMLTRAAQQDIRVAEVGVPHQPRRHGHSKVSLRDVPRTLRTLVPFWWSEVLFARDERRETRDESQERGERREARGEASRSGVLAVLVLAVVAGCLFFGRLGAPLLEPQEPRYAEIPRQMLVEGRWLVPVLHGQPYLDKPPLLYWVVMASYRLFGVHDWAARLVPGMTGLGTVLLAFWWGRRVLGERAGFLGALLLCLSAHFVYYGRMLGFDGLLMLWITAGWAAGHAAVRRSRLAWSWWTLSAVACGLGLLTKGLVALVLLAGPLAAHQLLDRRAGRIGLGAWLAWLGLALGLAAPWFVAVAWQEPGFIQEFFWRHHVLRFLAPFDHQEPAWFFLPGLALGLLPWTLLLPGFGRYLAGRSSRAARRRPAALGFLLLAFLGGLAFFSASGCKRAVYILPVWPPLALALGCYLDRRIAAPGWAALWRRRSRLAAGLSLTALAVGSGIAGVAGASGVLKSAVAVALAASGVLLCLVIAAGRRRITWATGTALTFGALFVGVQVLQPAYNHRFALRASLRSHASLAQRAGVPVLCYPQRWDSVSFYLPQANVRVYGRDQKDRLLADLRTHPEALLLVKLKSANSLQEFLRQLPESVEYVADRHSGAVTVGWVRQRGLPAAGLLAER